MTLNDYFIVNSHEYPITATNPGDKFCLVGVATGRKGFNDGDTVKTSSVETMDATHAKTFSGSIYELGEMNKDYIELVEAAKKGTTVISGWELYIYDPSIGEEYGIQAIGKDGDYIISGFDQHGNFIIGKVIDQKGNYITLVYLNSDGTTCTQECFVSWYAMSYNAYFETRFAIEGPMGTGKLCSKLEEAFGTKCRPVLQARRSVRYKMPARTL